MNCLTSPKDAKNAAMSGKDAVPNLVTYTALPSCFRRKSTLATAFRCFLPVKWLAISVGPGRLTLHTEQSISRLLELAQRKFRCSKSTLLNNRSRLNLLMLALLLQYRPFEYSGILGNSMSSFRSYQFRLSPCAAFHIFFQVESFTTSMNFNLSKIITE